VLMDKRYQVFVSSTYEDLREERAQVMQALLELDCIPSGMELFPAADEDQWTLIKEVIDDCDYYMVIVGGRYGSLHSSGNSYTQLEYEYALSRRKPTIAFLHQNPADIPSGKTESSDEGRQKLEIFRQLAQSKAVKYWSSPLDLGAKVSRSVSQLIKKHPAAGWIRAGNAAEAAAPEILRLRRRIDDLQGQLEGARYQPPEGSEALAQGQDKYKLNFQVEFVDSAGEVVWENEYWEEESWNVIFGIIAPHIIDQATEKEVERALENGFRPYLEKIADTEEEFLAEKWEVRPELKRIHLENDDLKTIIVQFRALGLIERDDRKRSARDLDTYWTLTPLGDQTMTSLRAIRRKKIGQEARLDEDHLGSVSSKQNSKEEQP
jgi:hypothetical protein